MIGEQLKRDDGQQGLKRFGVVGNVKDVVAEFADGLVPFGGDGEDVSAAELVFIRFDRPKSL